MYDEKDIEEVRKKILKRLDSSIVESDEETTSFYNILEACKSEFEPYTIYFRDNINKYGNKLNRKSKLENAIGMKSLSILYVVPEVINGKSRVDIYLQNSFEDKVGIVRIENDETLNLIDFDESLLSSKNNAKYINGLQRIFSPFLKVLNTFSENYDGIDYSWNVVNTNGEAIMDAEDDFLKGRINLNELSRSYVTLKDLSNMIVSSMKSKNYGIVYDYIEFYQDALMKRLPVRIDELNPLFRKILNKYLNIKEDKKLMLEK